MKWARFTMPGPWLNPNPRLSSKHEVDEQLEAEVDEQPEAEVDEQPEAE